MSCFCLVTQRNFKELRADMDRDYFLTPKNALEYGLIDKVLNDKEYFADFSEVPNE